MEVSKYDLFSGEGGVKDSIRKLNYGNRQYLLRQLHELRVSIRTVGAARVFYPVTHDAREWDQQQNATTTDDRSVYYHAQMWRYFDY